MERSLLENHGKVTCIKANDNIQLMLRIRDVIRYVKANKIHVIHAHLPWAGIISRIAGRLTRIPVIYTEHNKQERYHIATRVMNLATMNWLTRIIAVSEDVAASIRKHKPKLRPNLQVILNGVNTRHFAPEWPGKKKILQDLNIPETAPIIGTIAVFRFQKRLEVWIEVAKNILTQQPGVHFIIVGDGPLRGMLLEKTSRLGLTDRIHFAGLQTEVRPYLAIFDLYMMSSVFEGLPIALLEAMSSGCAVVSTNAGGIKEVIRHDVDGLICNVDAPELLTNLAVGLLRAPDKRKSLGIRARQRIIDSFSLETMVASLEKVYEELYADSSRTGKLG
jgi:glycosyltransferase involved in cell wall biosynthesis